MYIEYQGFKHLGVGYLGKFFPFGEFKKGFGAGAIALFVGLTELLLEFVKPVTLSMRLFGNIYGGEVALGVLTALTLAIIPMAMLALEVLLNAVQALIFATLTLMFTLVAIEGHGEEDEAAESAEATIHAVEAAAALTTQPREHDRGATPGHGGNTEHGKPRRPCGPRRDRPRHRDRDPRRPGRRSHRAQPRGGR